MRKDLIVVESPNKIKSIQSYVGDDYVIAATGGHIRELAKRGGYDPQTYDLRWEVIKQPNSKFSKQEVINDIINLAKKADKIFLATDPDREGEAISWHVYDILPDQEKERVQRITFNEITKKAIQKAIDDQHDIDINLVGSQFARRIFDRVIGYRLSSLVQRNLRGQSAGRVQSIALLFVVQRELERQRFVKEEWYQVEGTIQNNIFVSLRKLPYQVPLYKQSESSDSDIRFLNKEDAQYVIDNLGDWFEVYKVDEPKTTSGDQQIPLTTDKLLQMASNYLNWSSAKTTSVAQQMFEGIQIGEEHLTLISYPRTDSERLSDDFIVSAHDFITETFGNEYINLNGIKSSKKTANVQDAHEAIRPIDVHTTPNMIKPLVSADVFKLYNLIWTRTLSALMNPPKFHKQIIRFINNEYKFYTSYKTVISKGYWILDFYSKQLELYSFLPPVIKVGDKFKKKQINLVQKETLPPPYYTEATLIAALKNAGVGRPSTYASMATIGTKRGYINKDNGKLIPTQHGIEIIKKLQESFPQIISAEFTSQMEDKLDLIANGEMEWKEPVKEFIPGFLRDVQKAYTEIEKKPYETVPDRVCPQCSGDLQIKFSKRNVSFIACSNFPKCRFVESLDEKEILDEKCPECSNNLIKRKNRKNKLFIGCSGYPNCNYIKTTNKSNKKETQ
ncbi:DNA topoisomerase I [Ureaplasma diversum]|uniref:DNA topoisomerase 1 n=1 Tax=Ureaplasma diversum TaxID=42094 RepID=A0A0C5RM05_9BACT|nr:type I DNA topoisomerase [Ureaplasma diversum]AJQ45427.1 DNA topoisomerase I [Ureaplasma diversum]